MFAICLQTKKFENKIVEKPCKIRIDTSDKKNDFLSFMIDNRNVLISLKDIFSELNLITK